MKEYFRSDALSLSQLEIPVPEIYSSMGFRSAGPDEVSRGMTDTLLREAYDIVHPCFEYIVLDGERTENTVTAGGEIFDTGRIISGHLRGAAKLVAFVATVGEGWLEWMEMLKKRDDVLQSFIADCIGSQIAESTADYMERTLQEELDAGQWHRTNRFSPGYCGWHVSQQQRLFSLFPEEKPCGITLTDSCLMVPVKSVSGIIGVGPSVRYMPYTCNICDMKMCLRRKGRT